MTIKRGIIVHGGAWSIPSSVIDLYRKGVEEAARAGMDVLRRGGTALDSVEVAVSTMEGMVIFNSGKGATANSEGEIELDAMIMDGLSLRTGGVAAVKNILNPISLARKVMENTEHVLIVGDGASSFARSCGFTEKKIKDSLTAKETRLYNRLVEIKTTSTNEHLSGGTVGAVAVDSNENIASGTSTGGTPGKLPGRVGDSPIPGCGAYADNQSGGVSATGWGESIMKLTLAKHACDLMGKGISPIQACRESINTLAHRVGGWGGLIAINATGRVGAAYNTGGMAQATMTEEMSSPNSSI